MNGAHDRARGALRLAAAAWCLHALAAAAGCRSPQVGDTRADGAAAAGPRAAHPQQKGAPQNGEPDARAGPAAGDAEPEGPSCRVPDVDVPRTPECDQDGVYPECKWSVPDPGPDGHYEIWRYTRPHARWGRPALVALVLATAAEYARETGGEKVVVGDLDAPGDRHKTHDRGVDVDLYLPSRMARDNLGKGRTRDNYAGKCPSYVRKSRERVLLLARILASCTGGRLRIYYNDEPVIDRFLAWFDERGLSTPFESAMMKHNALHLFHFHVTVPEDLEVPAGPHP
jgi:hypothetical protein